MIYTELKKLVFYFGCLQTNVLTKPCPGWNFCPLRPRAHRF